MVPGFVPFRRDINFLTCKEIEIRPLIDQLTFITNKKNWGYSFRYGHLKITEEDFQRISFPLVC